MKARPWGFGPQRHVPADVCFLGVENWPEASDAYRAEHVRLAQQFGRRSLALGALAGNLCLCAELPARSLKMPKDRRSLAFFALIATSLCAAVVLIALLIAGDVAGRRVAMNNFPPHSQAGDRQ